MNLKTIRTFRRLLKKETVIDMVDIVLTKITATTGEDLDIEAGAADKDIRVKLGDDGGDSDFIIRDSNDAPLLTVNSDDGDVLLANDLTVSGDTVTTTLTGDLIGEVTGDVTGDVTGNITGPDDDDLEITAGNEEDIKITTGEGKILKVYKHDDNPHGIEIDNDTGELHVDELVVGFGAGSGYGKAAVEGAMGDAATKPDGWIGVYRDGSEVQFLFVYDDEYYRVQGTLVVA